ncbi:dye-decolorizing peroxidase precursor [Roridomyces roridus]|uniref:Dye-decolorizing peroxidase n=1 Tax=Roridomyces roridus TaxID=1738132 RepID=A0AAD7CBK0_9AGAR|nr:dye-decolorizing peroxidase precursor [Roridomyces roridus]
MRKSLHSFILVSLFAVGHLGVNAEDLPPRRRAARTKSLFIDVSALPNLPTVQAVSETTNALDTDNIQSDILIGMQKNEELFYFFGVKDAATFKSKLASDILPLITTTTEVSADFSTFSNTGLIALGMTDDLGDFNFVQGQFADVHNQTVLIGDNPSTWDASFAGTQIHGVFILASDTAANINTELANIQSILGASIVEIESLQGAARPGDQQGHEHFGFMDGISQPAVNGFTNPVLPGQTSVDPGTFLVGEIGDPNLDARPAWAKDGSFLVFRKLQQLVPEFSQFLTDHPLDVPSLTPAEGSELLGARMVGRWKSGAPVFLSPTHDDPVLAADPTRNNNFTYLIADALPDPGTENHFNQTNCPFGAHIRKVHPRGDLQPGSGEETHFIIRSSIPYGPEVTAAEAAANTTSVDRGLAFVSYQANIFNGFMFLQNVWINSIVFPFGKVDPTIGVDPIIGTLGGGPKNISGLDPAVFDLDQSDVSHDVVEPRDFVVSRGGEYFFSPSLTGLSAIAAA